MRYKLNIDYVSDTIPTSQVVGVYHVLDPFMEIYPLGDLLDGKDVTSEGWQDEQIDMKNISAAFPSMIFKLSIYDASADFGALMHFYKGGLYYQDKFVLTAPVFDEGQLA